MTADHYLELTVLRDHPEGSWHCAVLAEDYQQTVRLTSDQAVAEFLASQLEQLLADALRSQSPTNSRQYSR